MKTHFIQLSRSNGEIIPFACSEEYFNKYNSDETKKAKLIQLVEQAELKREKKDYLPIPLGDTESLENDEWLQWRKHGPFYNDPMNSRYIGTCIGGSDVSVVFGDNPWKSRTELFHEKSETEKAKYERPMQQEILDSGHQLEEFVALKAVQKLKENSPGTKVEMWNDTMFYQHPKYPWAVVNLDRRLKVNGKDALLECKTTGSYTDMELWKQGIVPKKYEWQCRYYMATMNIDYIYICCCWGFTLNECALILITRDKKIENTMMKEVADFIECCECGLEPELQTKHTKTLAAYYSRLYGKLPDKAPAVELPDTKDVYNLVESAQSLFERKRAAEKVVEMIQEEEYLMAAQLMKLMGGQSNYASYRLDDTTVVGIKIKQPMTKASFDEERFKNEHPDLYTQYEKKSLDVTELKKKEKLLSNQYVIPAKLKEGEPCSIGKVELKAIPIRSVI